MDLVQNFGYSTVAVAPSPATSGTTLTVAAGDGEEFPPAPFNLIVWPAPGPIPLDTNAEIVRVTSVSTDTFTIVRQTTTETSNASRAILVGDQVMLAGSAKTITDIGLASQLGNLTAVGHSWLNSGGTPPETMGRQNVLGRLATMFGMQDDNFTNLALSGSGLTVINSATPTPFSGWAGALQFILPDNAATAAGPSSIFTTYAMGALAIGPGVILHGLNDPSFDNASWSITSSGVNQGLNAWPLALTAVISRMRAGNVYGSTSPAGSIVWDGSIAFNTTGGSHWNDLAQVTGNTGPAIKTNGTTNDTVTITLPTNVPAAFTVAVCFIGASTGYTTLGTTLTSGTTGNITVGSATEFPASGSFIIKIDNEEIQVTFVNSTTLSIATRGVNGTSAAAHSIGANLYTAADTASVAFSGTVANSTGTTQLNGQGYAGNPISIVKRIACTSADAGKTIIATTTVVAGAQLVAFDSWWFEAQTPPPVVVCNTPRTTAWGSFATWVALNASTTTAVAAFDSAVQIADLDGPVYARSATLTPGINNAVTSIAVVANGQNFPQSPGFRITVFNPADASAEDMLVTAISGTYPNLTLTVTRGYNGTSAVAHANNADVQDRSWWYTDNSHPNDFGSAVFATQMYSAFQAAMTQQSIAQPYQAAVSGGYFVQHNQAPTPNLVDNNYLPTGGNGTTTTGANVANLLQLLPFYVPQLCVIVEAGVNVATLGALSAYRLGIYVPANDGRPVSRLCDFGTVATTSAVFSSKTGLYQVLRPGWYFSAAVEQGGTPSSTTILGAASFPGVMVPTGGTFATGYSYAGVSGALPDTLTLASLTPTFNLSVVWLRLRTKSWA